MLEQTIMSYIQEGWPNEQIVILDNTGYALESGQGQSQPEEHYFLNYTKPRRLKPSDSSAFLEFDAALVDEPT